MKPGCDLVVYCRKNWDEWYDMILTTPVGGTRKVHGSEALRDRLRRNLE